jgi:hypothetical protein
MPKMSMYKNSYKEEKIILLLSSVEPSSLVQTGPMCPFIFSDVYNSLSLPLLIIFLKFSNIPPILHSIHACILSFSSVLLTNSIPG